MSPDVLTIAETPDALLESLRRAGPAGVFYHRGLLELWERVYGWQGVVLTSGGAALAGFRKPTPLGRIFYSLPFGWHGGLVGERPGGAAAAAILGWLRSQAFVQETIVQFGDAAGAEYPSRYRRRELAAHLLPLDRPAAYSANAVRNVKKAQGCGLATRRLAPEERGTFVQLLRDHVQRTREPRLVPEASYVELFALALREDSGVDVCGAFRDGELLACHVYFRTASDGFYFDGFCNQAGLDTCANFLLFDTVLRAGRERGAVRFNFGATPEGDHGLERFKAGWGAEVVHYREYERRSPVKRALDRVRGR